ncbi:hypothetical protein FEM48_Zijuj03G0129500 [Ziziphus jujuba var. spinosa]|uniref:Beta-glucosidase 24-like n=1 Tax=Ziziphus jujuba var. spinosa TaxID=714518 RepID=A0A978VQF4_ZIZJJ|nr:hypothetical protein FEM48_Zijuj03G0129500 [Ziziphus jujuba var. spinosa]
MGSSQRPSSSTRILQGLVLFFTVALLNASSAKSQGNVDVKKLDFPKNFAFGVATAAAQEDVQHLKELGVKYYRFSISWTRILPQGSLCGGINQEGIDHYNNLIDELLKNGITPFVTLFHFDFPQALQDKYGGFLSPLVVNDFKDYCKICFKAFGDRVKNWITINEPYIMAFTGYDLGTSPPGRCSPPAGPAGPCVPGNSSTEPYIVSHNVLLAHAEVVKLYRKKFQVRGTTGIWWLSKKYAKDLKNQSAPPRYSTDYLANVTAERNGVLIGPKAEGSDFIYYYPKGLQKLLEFMQQKYQHPTIYITENGITEANIENRRIDEALKDEHRISSIKWHLYYLLQAMKSGVNVKGYFYWALFDDFEWGEGYEPRFGLYYIDYQHNLTRIPKNSAKWLKGFLEAST